jgi:hypothetical protein
MKKLACLSVIGLLSLPITAQAQVLPPAAADCYLALIAFKAQAATGEQLLVPTAMYPTWRYYFANNYTMLPDPYQAANACWEYNNITTRWPRMGSAEQEMWLNIWKTTRVQETQFIEPVFPNAATDLRIAYLKQLAEQNARQTQQYTAPSATQDNSQAAIIELQRRYQFGQTLLKSWQ